MNGGAATTLYGADAADGVLQIFTKKRGDGKAAFSLETTREWKPPPATFCTFNRTADLLYQNGATQQYTLGVNGGDEEFGFSLSGNLYQSDGTRIHDQNYNKKYDLVTGVSGRVTDWMDYEGSLSYVNNNFTRVRSGNAGGLHRAVVHRKRDV